ncbi:hypothetical protein KY092_08620 [Natronomonas gomsonensis]|jgi:hypothetical protein|uniref:hypothetical protein n=1 Tax=Natronomonas gomsonensis TaxID=1046043 RepID=UPI0020CA4E2D|nr:hypothetical protein [Natronomonas gomsonensis]MCY4730620.1 hypothetical protein [Natronomonas gomsonensis]
MKRGRAYEEAAKLGDRYPIRYSEANRRVIIERFDYPEGWNPRFAPMRYDLPETYPRDVPTVYVSGTVSYERGKPEHLLNRIHPADDDDGEWAKWCIRDHFVNWDPERDSLVKLTSMMRASLANPNSDNPFNEA